LQGQRLFGPHGGQLLTRELRRRILVQIVAPSATYDLTTIGGVARLRPALEALLS
jgi:hypothetical protein